MRAPRGYRMPALMAALCLAAAAGLAAPGPLAAQQAGDGGGDSPALITGVELRSEAGTLRIHFSLSAPARHELVANPRKRVAVVKFHDAVPGLSGGKRRLAYNHPLLLGIVFETIDGDTWAKIRLRTRAVRPTVAAETGPRRVVVGLQPAPSGNALVDVRLGRHEAGSRVVLELEQPPRYELQEDNGLYIVRLANVTPGQVEVSGQDERVSLLGAERTDGATLVRIQTRQPSSLTPSVLTDPARLVLDFAPRQVAAAPEPPPAAPQEEEQAARRAAPPPERLDELLAGAPEEVRANYQLAEQEFRAGNFSRARRLFEQVRQAVPETALGVRARFRAADAQYEQYLAADAANFHPVITSYQAALRQAERQGYESALVARALFQIGRSYQRMDFANEANVHYEILQRRFPDNVPYTADAYYYRGETFLAAERHDRAIQQFRTFLEGPGQPALEGPALYKLGDAFYEKEDYVQAQQHFDQARQINPGYGVEHPLLLFHMGETYYENAEFATAREIYRELLERYPDKPYTQLVALRLGDFYLEEGKEADALRVYRQVSADAPQDIRLRARMRIAGIFANRPTGDDYERAVELYEEVVQAAPEKAIGQEALLRKALTYTLHNRYRDAIAAFERLRQEYPESPYLRPNLTRHNIEENLKGLVDALYRRGEHWEVAKVYTRYRDGYMRDFRFPVTRFQVADAYHHLGLYEEAMALYGGLTDGRPALNQLVRYRTAVAHMDRDQLRQAEEALLRFIQETDPGAYRIDARMLLGEVYLQARRYEDALNAYRLIIRDFEGEGERRALDEAAPEAYYRLGQVHKELGEFKAAADAFANAVSHFQHPIQGDAVPEYIVRSHFLEGDMLFELHQDDEALRQYQQAIARYPGHERAPWAMYQQGLIHRRQGRDAKALEIFNALVDRAEEQPGELWESLAKDNQRELVNVLQFREYLNQ